MKKYAQSQDGSYQTVVWDGTYSKNGRKHYKHLRSYGSSKDLEIMVEKYKRELDDIGTPLSDPNARLYDFAQSWLKTFKSQREKSTIEMYERVIRILENSSVGHIAVCKLEKKDLQQLMNENCGHPRTCLKIMLTYKQLVKYGISNHILRASALFDLCSGISYPKYHSKERRPLTDVEIKALRDAGSHFTLREAAFIQILLGCGLRREEAIALTRFDIDLKRNVIRVNKAIGFYHGQPYEKSTKNTRERSVPMPPKTVEALTAYLPTVNTPYLFTDYKHKQLTAGTYNTLWYNVSHKIYAQIPGGINTGLTAHIFRHNYCTRLCYQIPSISIKKIADLMGDTEAMVMNVYSHIMDEKEDISGALERFAAETM